MLAQTRCPLLPLSPRFHPNHGACPGPEVSNRGSNFLERRIPMFKSVCVFTSGLVLLTSLWRTSTVKRLFCGLAALTLLLESVGQVRSDFIYWSDSNDGN